MEKREQFVLKCNGKTKRLVTKENDASTENARKRHLNILEKANTPPTVSTSTKSEATK